MNQASRTENLSIVFKGRKQRNEKRSAHENTTRGQVRHE